MLESFSVLHHYVHDAILYLCVQYTKVSTSVPQSAVVTDLSDALMDKSTESGDDLVISKVCTVRLVMIAILPRYRVSG